MNNSYDKESIDSIILEFTNEDDQEEKKCSECKKKKASVSTMQECNRLKRHSLDLENMIEGMKSKLL